MSFVVGHKEVISKLKNVLTGKKHPHALLFVGREGIGKRRVALLSACFFMCPEEGCLECRTCRRIMHETHSDVRVETPKGKRSILIEQIRELKEWAFTKPMEGERKVAILDDAHLMKAEAANALLKTLEEPPENTLLILITSEPSRLLPTIVSRCQVVRFSPLKKEEVEEICERERVPQEIKSLCIETGSLMFTKIEPSRINLAQKVAKELIENPSLSLMKEEEIWKEQQDFLLMLFLVRKLLNRKLKQQPEDIRIQNLHRKLLEVERLAYGSNVNPRSLYEYLILEALKVA